MPNRTSHVNLNISGWADRDSVRDALKEIPDKINYTVEFSRVGGVEKFSAIFDQLTVDNARAVLTLFAWIRNA